MLDFHKTIPIKNIYYMIAYSYGALEFNEYRNLGSEEFTNMYDLLVTILTLGIPPIIRNGLDKEYKEVSEQLNVVKGKINVNDTIKRNSLISKKLVVDYDEFSENTLVNQIIKSTLLSIISANKVDINLRKKIMGLLPYFENVDIISIDKNTWSRVIYRKNNKRYNFIVVVCRHIHESTIFSFENTDQAISSFSLTKLSTIFEGFVRELLKKETDYNVTSSQIPWLSEGNDFLLPTMQTDMIVKNKRNNKTVIIDTKFYTHNLQNRFDTSKQISSNMYQIFTYVNNYNYSEGEIVSGMLLYARTIDDVQSDQKYVIKKNVYSVVTLDLSNNFKQIRHDIILYVNKLIK